MDELQIKLLKNIRMELEGVEEYSKKIDKMLMIKDFVSVGRLNQYVEIGVVEALHDLISILEIENEKKDSDGKKAKS
jgi:hypothetical protein